MLTIAASSLCCGLLFAQQRPVDSSRTEALHSSQVGSVLADDAGEDVESPDRSGQLVKTVQNPVARLISIPFQSNSSFNVGPYGRTSSVLNFQPVIPLPLSENWNLIIRMIQPIARQPYVDRSSGREYGLGDMNPTVFLAPARAGKLIWGAGSVLLLPTAIHPILGQGKFGLGPSILLLTQPGPWTLGVQVNNVWSVAGSGGRAAVNQMTLQYFANHILGKGWYLAVSPTITANWRASNGNGSTIPVGGGIGRVTKLGHQTANIKAQFFGNVVYPSGTSPWKMQLQVSFLFPTASKD